MTDPKLDALREALEQFASEPGTGGDWCACIDIGEGSEDLPHLAALLAALAPRLSEQQLRDTAAYITLRLPQRLEWRGDRTKEGEIVLRLLRAALAASEPVMSTESIQNKSASNQSAEPASTPLGVCDGQRAALHAQGVFCENWRTSTPAQQEQSAPSIKCVCFPIHSQECQLKDARSSSYRHFYSHEANPPSPPQSAEAIAELRGLAVEIREYVWKVTPFVLDEWAKQLEAALERMKGDSQP